MNDPLILCGDVREQLAVLTPGSIQCVVTSPPYWGLRDYGVQGQIGLEETPEAYIANMVEVFSAVRELLSDDGTLWLNLGDSYSGSGKGGNPDAGKQATNKGSQTVGTLYGKTGESARQAAVTNVSRRLCKEAGMRPKNLVGIPWRVALALQADGWNLRSDIIWAKPNPMPESVLDRPTRAHEYLFLLTKSTKYFFDSEAMKEPAVGSGRKRMDQFGGKKYNGKNEQSIDRRKVRFNERWDGKHSDGSTFSGSTTRNRRDVWVIGPQPFKGAHFAVMPEALVEPCVLAGSRSGDWVLDPFCGSGTVGVVCKRHDRQFVGIELNADYVALAEQRIADA